MKYVFVGVDTETGDRLYRAVETIEESRERLKEAIFARNPGWDYLEQRRVEQGLDEARKEIFRLQEEKMALETKVQALQFQVGVLTSRIKE